MNQAPPLDENLWFTMEECCPDRHYLFYNPHTFPGRMGAWCPNKRLSFSVSIGSIDTCSREAEYWVKGFLTGNEPPPPRDDEGDLLPPEAPQYRWWRAAIELFATTGIWVVSERECKQCGAALLPSLPGLICQACKQLDT